MASTAKKWALGCGSGCLLVLIILGGIGTCGYVGVKRMVDHAKTLEASLEEVDDRFGPATSYVPPADGAIDAAQLEIFLSARADLLERSAPLTETLATLEGDGGPLAKIRAGMDLVPGLIQFVGQRGTVLLDNDLHPGEYAYIYSLVYFVWLEHDPGDGPGFEIDGDDESDSRFRWNSGDGDSEDVRQERRRSARRDLNALHVALLENQRDALALSGIDDPQWEAMLDQELAALAADRKRLAWQDGLPERLLESLEPYRDRLEEVYSEPLNGLEMSVVGNH